MEMGSITSDGQATAGAGAGAAEPAVPGSDIMQVARIGDIVAMEKLFESGEFDATFSDDEGITPLHVGFSSLEGAVSRS
jgi:palmitoyltransferase